MRKIPSSIHRLLLCCTLIAAIMALAACGPDSKHFKITGHLLNLNQGEFLVYSYDGAMVAVDTIYVEGGRFKFQPKCEHEGTVVIVMPNKQEIPVFVRPGDSYSVDGDAHNMKELKVKGGKDNELMNDFRKSQASASDTKVPVDDIRKFISQHAKSPACIYLIRHYFLDSATPDYNTAAKLLPDMRKAQPDNAALTVLQAQVTELMNTSAGERLPSFSVQDIEGRNVSDGSLSSGVVIFTAQASWDYESSSQMNRIIASIREKNAGWRLVVISFDAALQQCKNTVHIDSNIGYVVCDGNMSESALAKKLAISQTGQAVVVRDGKIMERNKNGEDLVRYLKDL